MLYWKHPGWSHKHLHWLRVGLYIIIKNILHPYQYHLKMCLSIEARLYVSSHLLAICRLELKLAGYYTSGPGVLWIIARHKRSHHSAEWRTLFIDLFHSMAGGRALHFRLLALCLWSNLSCLSFPPESKRTYVKI